MIGQAFHWANLTVAFLELRPWPRWATGAFGRPAGRPPKPRWGSAHAHARHLLDWKPTYTSWRAGLSADLAVRAPR